MIEPNEILLIAFIQTLYGFSASKFDYRTWRFTNNVAMCANKPQSSGLSGEAASHKVPISNSDEVVIQRHGELFVQFAGINESWFRVWMAKIRGCCCCHGCHMIIEWIFFFRMNSSSEFRASVYWGLYTPWQAGRWFNNSKQTEAADDNSRNYVITSRANKLSGVLKIKASSHRTNKPDSKFLQNRLPRKTNSGTLWLKFTSVHSQALPPSDSLPRSGELRRNTSCGTKTSTRSLLSAHADIWTWSMETNDENSGRRKLNRLSALPPWMKGREWKRQRFEIYSHFATVTIFFRDQQVFRDGVVRCWTFFIVKVSKYKSGRLGWRWLWKWL